MDSTGNYYRAEVDSRRKSPQKTAKRAKESR